MILVLPEKYSCNNNDFFKVTNADVDFIKPTQPYERPKPLSSRQNYFNNVEAGLPLEKDVKHSFKAKWTLGHYTIKGNLNYILCQPLYLCVHSRDVVALLKSGGAHLY